MSTCPPPTSTASNWEVCTSLTIALDERDGAFTTSLFYYESMCGDEEHEDRAQAEARVAALLGGLWKEYFDEAVVVELEETIASEAEERKLAEADDETS